MRWMLSLFPMAAASMCASCSPGPLKGSNALDSPATLPATARQWDGLRFQQDTYRPTEELSRERSGYSAGVDSTYEW